MGNESIVYNSKRNTMVYVMGNLNVQHFWNRVRFQVLESMGFDSKNRFLTVVFDSCFFRSKEPNLAMNAGYKVHRKYPSHNMKIY